MDTIMPTVYDEIIGAAIDSGTGTTYNYPAQIVIPMSRARATCPSSHLSISTDFPGLANTPVRNGRCIPGSPENPKILR